MVHRAVSILISRRVIGLTLVIATGLVAAMPVGETPASGDRVVHQHQKVLFTHVSPDGSRVIARSVLVAPSNCAATPGCDSATGYAPGTQFEYTVDGHRYLEVVLASDSRLSEPGIVNPLFGSITSYRGKTQSDLIILHVRASVAEVRLPSSGRGGASPRGDHMAPVDGWVVFPVHNFNNLKHPEAFDSEGKLLGSSLPFPCC